MRDKIINGISHYFILILTEKCVSLIAFYPIIMYLSSKTSHQIPFVKYLFIPHQILFHLSCYFGLYFLLFQFIA